MKYNKLSDYKIKKIIKCFAADVTATQAALLTGINRNTINAYYNDLREKILKESLKETALDAGEFEVSELLPKGKSGCAAAISLAVRDESYFGAKRVRGKRGRGAAGKTPVFGLLKRGGKVFVKIVKNCSKEELLPIIQGKILENSVIHSDGWKAYDGLIVNGYDHYRVYHSHNEFARGKSHVNGIENFWIFAKRRLAKFNGCASDKFVLHSKECEFRYNHRDDDLAPVLWHLFKKN